MRISARNQGFTLVEILIVVSLVTILTGATIPRFTGYMANQNLKQAQEQVKSDLRSAVVRALAGVGAADVTLKYWGVRFTAGASKYDTISCKGIVTDPTCNSPLKTQTSEKLPGNIVVKNSGTILFDTIKGNSTSTAAINVILGPPSAATGSDKCAAVQVNSVGLVTKVEVLCP